MSGWLVLFRGEFWRLFFVSLRRFRRDARARRRVLATLGLLLYVGAYFRFFLWPLVLPSRGQTRQDTAYELIFATILLTSALALRGLWKLFAREEGVSALTLRTAPTPGPSHTASLDGQVPLELWRHTCVLAALLQRGGSESAMETVRLAPGQEIATRAWQRDRLRALGFWDDLPAPVRNLLLQADGHWTTDQIEAVHPLHEALFVLRWALGLDPELRPLDREPVYQAKLVVSTLGDEQPRKLALRPSWDLRAARDTARELFARFWVEAVARGLAGSHLDEDGRAGVLAVREEYADSTDILIGVNTVRELEDGPLARLAESSRRRYRLLALLTEVACGDSPPEAVAEQTYGALGSA